jgi:prepilin-type N-terminal cleavage/methylation domain-containing protein
MRNQRVTICRRGRRGNGFTLMEMLVVMGIFSVVVTAASDIFMLSNRVERKVFASEKMQSDARYTLEAMVREVRTDSIDYGYYSTHGGLKLPEDRLALIGANGDKIVFSKDTTCYDAASSPCLVVAVNGGTAAPMTPKNVKLRQLVFYVSPNVDPMSMNVVDGTYASGVQPRVTIVMVLEGAIARSGESNITYTQTTAVSRQYGR